METPFYYILKVNLIRFIENGKIDFISEEREFINENPIIAREKAINSYESYIDTLIGENILHSEAEKLLSNRIVKNIIEFENEKIETNDMFSGIGVFMKINQPIDENEIGDELLIHGVGFSSGEQELMQNLNIEIEYYKHYKFDTKNYITEIMFEKEGEYPETEIILKTPNNWKENKKRLKSTHKKENYDNENNNFETQKILKYLIKKGEGKIIEFKSSLFTYKNYYGEIGYSRHIKFNIAKTIASFLNSKGGFLFIGIKDDKSIIGLDADFSLASKNGKNDKKDFFKLEVDRIIREYYKASLPQITGDFHTIDNKLIYVFKILPSNKPIFIMNATDNDENLHKKEFYVRLTGASSVLYENTEDIINYCFNHWCNKK